MSKIEWTDQTWNPTTGCSKISPGCKNCYMFRQYPRLAVMGVPGYDGGDPSEVRLMPDRIDLPQSWKKPRMVFVNSMSDLFHEDIPHQFILEIFFQMQSTPQHTYQVLTKRPERAAKFYDRVWSRRDDDPYGRDRPLPPNVWMGVSVESQDYAHRIDTLAEIDVPVRFVSAEPLLDTLRLSERLRDGKLDWVIVGGESGPKARPMELDWARRIRDECNEYDVPFFLKQLGGRGNKRGGNKAILDGKRHTAFPQEVTHASTN